jgi:hypothetical protein
MATGIQTVDLHLAWPGLWPLLKPAYDYSPDKDDLLAGIRERRFALWAVYARNIAVAGIVTRPVRDPTSGELHCHLWLVGGSRLYEWAGDFIAKLKPWAKAEGFTMITGNGRKGWDRIVRKFGGVRLADRQGMPCWGLAL